MLERLPTLIVAGDEFHRASRLPRERAVLRRYIQPNPPSLCIVLAFDLDHDAPEPWRSAKVAEPSVAVRNPATGHAHLGYLVAPAVAVRRCDQRKGERYLAAIEGCMLRRLGADSAYNGLWMQSPWSGAWDTRWGRTAPYTLRELAAFVPEVNRWRPPRVGDMAALGRNCDLFESIRHWAYRHVLDAKRRGDSRADWLESVLERCLAYTAQVHDPALPYSECRHTAKSIAWWTWRKFTLPSFSQRQAALGRRSRGGGRPGLGAPWKEEGVSRATWFRRRKAKERSRAIVAAARNPDKCPGFRMRAGQDGT